MLLTLRRNFAFLSVFLVSVIGLLPAAQAAKYQDDAAPGMADGAGVWANIWNYPQGDLETYCTELEQNGIKNVFIQTSRSTTVAVPYPEKLGPLIDACHKHHIRVIAWSFSELFNPISDADKMIAAANFTSPAGGHVDAIAPNLEKNLEPARIEQYSLRLREKLGRNYPMLAVVYSPLNHCQEVQRISWPLLAKYYDAIAPMIYWNSKYQKIDPYSYTVETIQKIRELSGKPNVEIHAIGDGMGTKAASIIDFLRACKDAEATGLSLYPNQRMTLEQTKALAKHPDYLAANARFRLAAFSDFVGNGSLSLPPKKDPSQPIARRDFYRLTLKQMYPALLPPKSKTARAENHGPFIETCREATGEQAYKILANHDVLLDIDDKPGFQEFLAGPISPPEAVNVLARLVSLEHDKTSSRNLKQAPHKKHWFLPAAQAETSIEQNPHLRPVNYLDASQMVLQAMSALR